MKAPSNAGLEVRGARKSDAQILVGWFADHAAAVSWGGPAVPDPLTASWLAQELQAASHLYRTAVTRTGSPAGFYGLQLFPAEARAHVRRLATDPSRRRQGVARLLLRDAAATASSEGAHRLSLNVYGSNVTARAVYERLGWTYVASSPAPEDPSGWRFAMELLLEPTS